MRFVRQSGAYMHCAHREGSCAARRVGVVLQTYDDAVGCMCVSTQLRARRAAGHAPVCREPVRRVVREVHGAEAGINQRVPPVRHPLAHRIGERDEVAALGLRGRGAEDAARLVRGPGGALALLRAVFHEPDHVENNELEVRCVLRQGGKETHRHCEHFLRLVRPTFFAQKKQTVLELVCMTRRMSAR